MITKYRAYAIMEDGNGKEWRVNISNYDTEIEAREAAARYAEKYSDFPVRAKHTGIHKYYIIPRLEWNKEQYTGVSIDDPTVKTWMINEGSGSALLFEGLHFEII